MTSPAPNSHTLASEPRAASRVNSPPAGATLHVSTVDTVFSTNPLHYQGELNGKEVRVLVDSGSMGDFVSSSVARRFSFSLDDVYSFPIAFANGNAIKKFRRPTCVLEIIRSN
jgi:hypothetical protein